MNARIVNLRTMRKRRAREEAKAEADRRAVEHGRTRAERQATGAENARAARQHEAHRRDAQDGDDDGAADGE